MTEDPGRANQVAGNREQRTIHRHHLIHYLRVYDGLGSKVVGHVVDISTRGVKLITETPIGVQEEYRLRMRFPGRNGSPHTELMLDAVCKWCRADNDNPEFFLVGFQIRNINAEEADCIRRMIRELGM